MTRALLGAGGAVFALLGIVHAILTIGDVSRPRTFTPPDPQLRAAMMESSVAIHPTANLWRAWLGFNLSHALGVTVFGTTLTVISINDVSTYENNLAIQIGALVIGATYIVLAKFFWFRNPLVGACIGTLFLAAASFS